MRNYSVSAVRFSGPLAVFAGWWEALLRDGYAPGPAAVKLRLAAHLSRWMQERGMEVQDLNKMAIKGFLEDRRATHKRQASLRALEPFLGYLRSVGAMADLAPELLSTPQAVLAAEFQEYLRARRGLSPAYGASLAHWIGPFLDYLQAAGCRAQADEINGELIAGYLTSTLSTLSPSSAKRTANALRSFLRFTHAAGYSTTSLAAAVPPIVSWRLAGLPRPLGQEDVAALLAAADRGTSTGKRDYAVLLLMLRMGLRRQEVSMLRLRDVGWAAGSLVVHGKGNRIDTLPLPVDVGEALVDYLCNARPPGLEAGEIFIRACAPYRGLGPAAISYIVSRLSQRAGIGTVFAHRLRHTAASNVLNAGASMEEVAQFLRHTGTATASIYAKVDMSKLAGLARPWPEAGTLS